MNVDSGQNKNPKRQNLWAIFLGLIVLYLGDVLLNFLFIYLAASIDKFSPVINPSGNIKNPMEAINEFEANQIYRDMFLYGFFALKASLFILVGWIVAKKAQSKAWYFAAIPIVIVFLFHLLTIFVGGIFSVFSFPLSGSVWTVLLPSGKYYGWIFCLLSALLGGFIAKRFNFPSK